MISFSIGVVSGYICVVFIGASVQQYAARCRFDFRYFGSVSCICDGLHCSGGSSAPDKQEKYCGFYRNC